MGAITAVKYQTGTDVATTAVPTNAGTYVVSVDVAEGTHYDAVSNLVLGNYVIEAKPITVTPKGNQTKVYGESDPTYTYDVSPDLVGDDSFTGALARVTGKDVGTYAITPKEVTIADITVEKEYDGTKTINTDDITIALEGVEIGDDVNYSEVTLTFAETNVGSDISINKSTDYSLTGTKAGNYTLTQITGSGTIDPKPVTIIGITVENKVYDGNNESSIGTIDGKVTSDNLDIIEGSATFANVNVADGITVGFTNFSLTGTDAGNYNLTDQPVAVTANITAKDIADASVSTSAIAPQYDYEGVALTPAPVVADELIAPLAATTDYSLAYSQNDAIGTATITITGEGNYKGTRTIDFIIVDRRSLSGKLTEITDDILKNPSEKEKYTDESTNELEKVLAKGEEVVTDIAASQAELDAALQAAQEAIDNLVECIPFNYIINTRWNNTLTVSNNIENNGGNSFTPGAYQWYVKHEGETEYTAIPRATGQYFSVGPKASDVLLATDRYRVTMYTEAGQLTSCAGHPEIDANATRSAKASIVAYPNPVKAGGIVTIEGVEAGNAISVFNQNATCVLQTIATGTSTDLQLNVAPGNYVVKTSNGDLKVIVK